VKRFLLPAALAVVFHAFFFNMEAGWTKKKANYRLRAEPITFTLSYRKPKIQARTPAKKSIETNKKPVPIKKRPPKKKTKTKPPKKIKKTAPSQKTSIPEKNKPTTRKAKPRPPMPKQIIQSKVTPAPAPSSETDALIQPEEPEAYEEEIDFSEAVPAYRKNPSPKYPRRARRRGYEGTVILDVFVSKEGRVADMRIDRSSGYPVLDEAAVASVKKWLFEPARRGDKKVEMWVKVPVRFRLR